MAAYVAALVGAVAAALLLTLIARAWTGHPLRGTVITAAILAFLVGGFELAETGLERGLADSWEIDGAATAAGAGLTLLVALAIGVPLILLSPRR